MPRKLVSMLGPFQNPEAMKLASEKVETRGASAAGNSRTEKTAGRINKTLEMALRDASIGGQIRDALAPHARAGNLLALAHYLSHNMTVDARNGEYVPKRGTDKEAMELHQKLVETIRNGRKMPTTQRGKLTNVFIAPAKAGSAYARNIIIELNMPLVLGIAGKGHIGGASKFEDRWMEGVLGLSRAIEGYSPEISGFSTYAATCIRHAINRSSWNESRNVRIPAGLRDLETEIWKYLKTLPPSAEEPSPADIAKKLGVAEKRVRRALEIGPDVPMNKQFNEGEPLTSATLLYADDRSFARAEDRILVEELMRVLTPRQRAVIRKRFWEGKTLVSIGRKINIGRERARQIEADALEKMRREA
ncbi:hypothetical protein COT29_02005 [Candidatus Micrarchaeota archaeon CG08_land_8_20_14_0_20_59_11]|nr:MAG: hypothetical protein COT29_02005 [Candidatus Micrarchaeota archaeon CG08_land_8_20_14_0_20_59_11]